ncbi:hypothetical protein B0A48_10797 [Cryoendolithus antarcticus]|uniref:Uncharacterized protein n=1 Tax=Cryoendolithus antarcticus TaxID=1507870 RepID=A0A1V8SYF9_9PEZI|nr:hypothetical protein B0A48_10797 [Cryoendolithus antarcticus]
MGTRHLICIYHGGRFVLVQYGQRDGYPSGQGVKILAFLSKPRNIALLESKLPNLPPIPDEDNEANSLESANLESDWKSAHMKAPYPIFVDPTLFSLNRDAGAKILDLIVASTSDDRLPVIVRPGVWGCGGDVVFAYNTDFDSEVLEVYGVRRNHGSASDALGEWGRLDEFNVYGGSSEMAKWKLMTCRPRVGWQDCVDPAGNGLLAGSGR